MRKWIYRLNYQGNSQTLRFQAEDEEAARKAAQYWEQDLTEDERANSTLEEEQ